MEINYRRNLMANYMVIVQEEAPVDWEKEIIAHSKIDGIIFAEHVRENEQNQLWYNISGKQALDSILEEKRLNYEMLCTLFLAVYELIGRLEAFLLKPDGLLLLPECIFFDNGGSQVYFCYCPRKEKTLPEMFREWLEYLLEQVEHTDVAAVELTYQLYEQAVKEGFSLQTLQKLLHINYEKEEIFSENEEYQSDAYGEMEELKHENRLSVPKKREHGKREKREAATKEKWNIVQSLRDIWKNVFCGKKQREVEEKFVFEPEEEEEEIKQSRPTVLLSELVKKPEGILRYEGTGSGRDLEMTSMPYVIGSDASCEGYIQSSTVSRKHARITREDDIYFIEDLNSSNGTYVGGEILNYRTKMSLEKNEIVMFADEKFRFI